MREQEINNLINNANDLLTKVIDQLNDMNWFVRKSDGLLYYYKYRPSRINSSTNLFPALKFIPIKGDKENLFKEESDALSFIPVNKLVHRDDLSKYKNKELKT